MTDQRPADAFPAAFAIVVGAEGRTLDRNPADAGNWTGGVVGQGELRGSKFGISAAAYPTLDIANLTVDDSSAIYRRDYWTRAGCQSMPAPIAMLVFDSAVNNGVAEAVRWLQAAVGVAADGVVGPATLAAVARVVDTHGGAAVAIEFMARRTYFMGGLTAWHTFGLGWSRRLAALPYHVVQSFGVVQSLGEGQTP